MNKEQEVIKYLENGLKEHNDDCILCAVIDEVLFMWYQGFRIRHFHKRPKEASGLD